jgi:hypothetical protein
MDRNSILKIIVEFTKRHENSKDGGTSFVIDISRYFNDFSEVEKNEVIECLINELKNPNYDEINLIYISILAEMKAYSASKYIYDIYNRYLKYKVDCDWEKYIIEVLLRLRYAGAEHLYTEYISKCKKDPNKGGLFFLGVLYTRADKVKGMDLLSDYFCENLSVQNIEISNFLKNRMGFLILNFIDISKDYIVEILRLTANKDKNAGAHLKEIMRFYLLSNNIPYKSKESMNEIAKLIE